MSDDLAAALAQIFTLDSFADGCAGAAGGTSAISVFYPLNKIRTDLQGKDPNSKVGIREVVSTILEHEGIPGFYRGWWGQIIALGSSNFIYFYTYNMLKVIIQKTTKRTITPVFNLAVGALAGAVNVLTTTPLWMVSSQLTSQSKRPSADPYKGMWDGLSRCYEKEGIHGLWKGLGPNLMLISNPTIHFFVYERIRIIMSKMADKRGSGITSLEFFLMGAMAKACATIFTYPIQVAQTQLRNDRKAKDGSRKYTNTADCLAKLYQAGGWKSWFQGMNAKLLQTVLTAAFQFMAYENIRVIVFQAISGKKKVMGPKKH